MFPQVTEQPARPGMSRGTSSIQDCCVVLKVKARRALVQSVSKAHSWDQRCAGFPPVQAKLSL